MKKDGAGPCLERGSRPMGKGTRAWRAALLAGVAAVALSAAAAADGASKDQLETLEQQIEALQLQVQELKRAQAAGFAEAQRQQAEAPKVTLSNGRPSFATSDGNFTASLRSTVQFDTAYYAQSGDAPIGRDLSSGTNFRRAQLGVEGTVFKDWAYSVIYDFGGGGGVEQQGRVSSAYIQYNGLKPFQIRAGAFAPVIGLEDSTSSADTLFLERPAASELSRANTGGDGRVGFQVAAIGETYLAAVSLTGSSTTSASVFDEQLAVNGRLAYLAYSDGDTKVVGSLSGVYLFDPADSAAGPGVATPIALSDRPELRVDGTQLIGTGNIDADALAIAGVETGAQWKNFYAQGGYFYYGIERRASALENPDFDAWYIEASWILTGEAKRYDAGRAAFRSPQPAEPFAFGDTPGLGAWEIAAKYSVANLNFDETLLPAAGGVRGGEQDVWGLALNWYPNNALRLQLNYQNVAVDRVSPGGAGFPAAGTDIGQDFDTIALRLQVAL